MNRPVPESIDQGGQTEGSFQGGGAPVKGTQALKLALLLECNKAFLFYPRLLLLKCSLRTSVGPASIFTQGSGISELPLNQVREKTVGGIITAHIV